DHPVVLHTEEGLDVRPAASVRRGDRLLALCDLPAVEPATSLNLIDLLRQTELEADVHVSPVDDSFRAQYLRFSRAIPRDVYRHPDEIRQHNRMPLWLFRLLRERGVLDVPAEKLRLYTALGAATKINAVLPVDADCLRLLGYYVAEGYITKDV